jgi:hypothetical protein
MPNVSKATASETVTVDGLEVSLENFDGGYTVCFESHTADADLTPSSGDCPTTAASSRAGGM